MEEVEKTTTHLITHWKKGEYPSVKFPVDILMGECFIFATLYFRSAVVFKKTLYANLFHKQFLILCFIDPATFIVAQWMSQLPDYVQISHDMNLAACIPNLEGVNSPYSYAKPLFGRCVSLLN